MRSNMGRHGLAFALLVTLAAALAPVASADILCGYVCQGPIGNRHCVESAPSSGCQETGPTSCAHYGNCWGAKSEQAGFWGQVADDTQQAYVASGEPVAAAALDGASPASGAAESAAGFELLP